ncbi:hypothetical protein NEOC65_001484 [Neochlamydia sp. AcF65]|nr:hypothetical protein [Neochlamydia sp. AcF65]MBS4169352.1 hypothetical protein [Neochlamydia sp. AcF95]
MVIACFFTFISLVDLIGNKKSLIRKSAVASLPAKSPQILLEAFIAFLLF